IAASSSIINTEPGDAKSSRPAKSRLIAASSTDCLPDHGEFHDERRPAARRAVNPDFPRVFLNDSVGDGKSQARPAASARFRLALSGEEGVINTMDVFLRDATSGICDLDLDVMAIQCADGQSAAARHGILGVKEQVQEDLLQLAGVPMDRREVR